MSRSYKKSPYWGQKKTNKRIARRRVRYRTNQNEELIVNNGLYKKLFEYYDISDYGHICSFQKYLSHYIYNKQDGLYYDCVYDGYVCGIYTRKQLYIQWYMAHKRK